MRGLGVLPFHVALKSVGGQWVGHYADEMFSSRASSEQWFIGMIHILSLVGRLTIVRQVDNRLNEFGKFVVVIMTQNC